MRTLAELATNPIIALVAKTTIVIGLAGFLTLVLRMRTAAMRHFVWASSFAGVAALAVVTPFAPSLDVVVARTTGITPPAITAGTPTTTPDAAVTAAAANSETVIASRPARTPARAVDRTTILFRTWMAVAALLLMWRALGIAGLARITRRGRVLHDPEWQRALDLASAALGMERRVSVVISSDVGSPVMWGHRRPVLLVPADAVTWSANRRRAVLLHELAHAARNDYALQLGAYTVCALYWFHPLIWFAARSMRNEAERACDDRALTAGIRGSDYATHLLNLAQGSRSHRLAGAAVGMARRSTLEGRMLAAIDNSVTRGSVSRRARATGAVIFALALIPLSALRAVHAVESTPSFAPKTASVAMKTPQARTRNEPPRQQARPAAPERRSAADTTIVRTFNVSRGGTLVLDISGGDIRVEGWNENRVELRAELGGRDWRDLELIAEPGRNQVMVKTEWLSRRNSQSASVSITVRVPNEFNLNLHTGGGSARIANVSGRLEGSSGGGTIDLRGLSGELSMRTGGGAITVANSNLDGTLSTGGGDITLTRVSGDLRPSTAGGRITRDGETINNDGEAYTARPRVEPGVIGGQVRRRSGSEDEAASVTSAGVTYVSKGSGDIHIAQTVNGAVATTGGGNVLVGRSGGSVEVTTGGGNVTVGPVSGSAAVTTGGGDVDVSLERAGGAQNVNVISGGGRVVIEIPRDFSGRVEIESGIPENGTVPKFTTPWNLNAETIESGDRRNGRVSRSLKATATVGSGRDTIKVFSGGGDVEIRFAR